MSWGRSSDIAAVCIGAEDDMEQRRQDILTASPGSRTGDGVVLLTDMFGGTPSNLAISVLDRANVEVIAGVNLPMLIKLASVRTAPSSPSPCCRPRKPAANTSTSPPSSWPTPAGERWTPHRADSRAANRHHLNQRGLHARAAAKFVKLASEFEAEIHVRRRRADGRAGARSWA